ncbi:MAG: GH32 C-terminal domain-containing protein, partial [Armatimonadetes bacterium]|nr:GH32 C-terminal domain-containing protein [Armatimonadota bacterium]
REASAPVGLHDGVLELRVLVDRGVMEVFGNRGEAAFSAGGKLYGAGQESDGAITLAAGLRALVPHLEAHELASAWGV